MYLYRKVEVHVPHRVDVVSDGWRPWSSGGSHSENGVGVAYSRTKAILVRQVLGPENERLFLYSAAIIVIGVAYL